MACGYGYRPRWNGFPGRNDDDYGRSIQEGGRRPRWDARRERTGRPPEEPDGGGEVSISSLTQRTPNVLGIRGFNVNPGLKIETLRQAQGRLWGSRAI